MCESEIDFKTDLPLIKQAKDDMNYHVKTTNWHHIWQKHHVTHYTWMTSQYVHILIYVMDPNAEYLSQKPNSEYLSKKPNAE